MHVRNFKDLKVWKKAHLLVLGIYSVTKDFPDNEKLGLTNQLRRSAVSICANIVEGYTKSSKDFVRYLNIARGSLEETKYHLLLSKDLNYFCSKRFNELIEQSDEIGKMLYALMKSINFKKYLTVNN